MGAHFESGQKVTDDVWTGPLLGGSLRGSARGDGSWLEQGSMGFSQSVS